MISRRRQLEFRSDHRHPWVRFQATPLAPHLSDDELLREWQDGHQNYDWRLVYDDVTDARPVLDFVVIPPSRRPFVRRF